ncbi:MAG TPA: thiol:disulfide interchange protein DsbA/DsbL [Gammaproteobacteria bacterium]
MKRLALLFALCLTPLLAFAQSAAREVVEYAPVVPPVATSTGEQAEVVELFWYGCPHCYRLEPYIERWLEHKPANVAYVRIPAIFSQPTWELHAKLYYALESLGQLERLHRPFFDALHAQRMKLNSEEQVVQWAADQGIDAAEFRAALGSFAVATKVNRAKQLTRRYGIDGVPALIVEGRYRTGPSMAGTYANTMPVVDALVQKSLEERASGKSQ